ncbi:MAG: response regulator [Nitrospinae bacterium]|nr:response regulator [Nitrospinota bacterium]
MKERKKKILIVEDDRHIADSLRFSLNEEGYRTDTVYDGKDAIPKVKDYEPDLILLDVMLPGMNGFEICKELKGSESTLSIPILMLTSMEKTEDIIKGLDAGADDYITKPFSLPELFARVKSHLRSKEMYDALKAKEEDEELLLEITKKVSSSLDPKLILHTIVERMAEAFQLERCSVVYINKHGEHGYVIASHEFPDFKEIELNLSKYPEIIKVLKERHEVIINDICKEMTLTEVKAILEGLKIKAIAIFPIFFDDDIVGTLILRTVRNHGFSEREINLCHFVANIVANPLRNAYLFTMMRDESHKEKAFREEAEKAAERFEKMAKELQESKGELEAVLNSVDAGIIMIGRDYKIRMANKQVEKILGIAASEMNNQDIKGIISNRLKTLFKKPDEAENILVDCCEKSCIAEEMELMKPQYKFLNLYSSTVCDDYGSVIGRIFVFKESIKSEKLQSILHMAVAVKHEINNPLTAVLGNTELLIGECDCKDTERMKMLKTIRDQSLRIKDIVEKMTRLTDIIVASYGNNIKMIDIKKSG